ncbi:hypothetical protein MNBD_NITROSPINAE05-1263 [hydrothermal vent metagenome]|uniref:DUF2232 domain-containing protein n=1 Tax=hydrothermal vent metagenome TaxID=652676 RepID=A0A3B1D9J7_9ZZZZ
MSYPTQPGKFVLPVLLIFAAVFAVLFFPPMGALVGVFAPAPLIFVYLQRGQVVGMILMGLVFIVLMLLTGPAQAMLFAAEYVVMATILAETVKAQLTMDKCIFLSALGSMVLATFFLFVLFGGEASLVEFFQVQIMKHFDLSMEALKSMGENQADLDSMQEAFEETSRTFASAYPAFIMVGTLITAAVNFFLVRFVWGKLYGQTLFRQEKFSELVLPDFLIWMLILSAASLFFIGSSLGALGINLFALVLLTYFFQGLAVTVHILKRKKAHFAIWALVLFMIVIQPLLMGFVIGLGVFDIWVDFRKIRIINTEISE